MYKGLLNVSKAAWFLISIFCSKWSRQCLRIHYFVMQSWFRQGMERKMDARIPPRQAETPVVMLELFGPWRKEEWVREEWVRMRRVGGGSEGAVSEVEEGRRREWGSRSEDDDVTSGWGGVTSGHDLCELIGHVTCRDRSLLIGIVHYTTMWWYKQARTCLIGQN